MEHNSEKELSWSSLSQAFKMLTVHCQETKSSDGVIHVRFDNQFMWENQSVDVIYVDFCAYGLPDMDRHHTAGPFNSEQAAFKECVKLLQRQIRFINADRQEAGHEPMATPFVLLETDEEALENQAYFEKKMQIDHGIYS